MLVGEDKPGIGGEPLPGQKLKPKYSVFPAGMGSDAPAWVAFDKQVCTYNSISALRKVKFSHSWEGYLRRLLYASKKAPS